MGASDPSSTHAFPGAEEVPWSSALLTITLDDLQEHEFNPRQTQNPKYQEIKDSIRHRGIGRPLVVTRPPGATKFVLQEGGGTRLQILRELWEETGDPAYYRPHCVLAPWKGETDLLASHIVENEMRGSMMTIERALAAQRLREKIEARDQKSLSLRQLAKAFAHIGWKMDFSYLSKLLYAANDLFPLIPKALWAGLGLTRINELRRLGNAYQLLCTEQGMTKEASLQHWRESLWKNDSEDFSVDDLCTEMNRTLASELHSFENTIQAELDSILAGEPPLAPTPRPPDPSPKQPSPQETATRPTSSPIRLRASQGRIFRLANQLATRARHSIRTIIPSHDRPQKPAGYGYFPILLAPGQLAGMDFRDKTLYLYLFLVSGWNCDAYPGVGKKCSPLSKLFARQHLNDSNCAAIYQYRTTLSEEAKLMTSLEKAICKLREQVRLLYGTEICLWQPSNQEIQP